MRSIRATEDEVCDKTFVIKENGIIHSKILWPLRELCMPQRCVQTVAHIRLKHDKVVMDLANQSIMYCSSAV